MYISFSVNFFWGGGKRTVIQEWEEGGGQRKRSQNIIWQDLRYFGYFINLFEFGQHIYSSLAKIFFLRMSSGL